jgi:hypothetical protein
MMNNIEKSWNTFMETAFPKDCVGLEVEGIELFSLDTFSAGCIDTFIDNNGWLDIQRKTVLKNCVQELDIVVKHLEGDCKNYFDQLRLLSGQVLKAVLK